MKDASNTLVSGTRTVTLTIYDASTGGTSQWSQTYTGISFTDGVFSMENTNLPSMYFDAGYYLALTVSSTGLSEILPRALLSSSKTSKTIKVDWDLVVF